MNKAFARQSVSILSPLRYPGAKRRLAGYVAEVIKMNDLKPKLFVEPFAGGASVSLQLLNDNIVERVVLGEIDSLVSAFWKVVFFDYEWLIDQIDTVDITVERWDFFKNTKFRSDREKALACIFLNRTSFSGIMASTAGPLGGRSQKSIYTIDCRFPRDTIKKRITQAAQLKDRISFISNSDWRKTIVKVELMKYKKDEVFYYLDPPFYYKADRLYRYFFKEEDHVQLRDYLKALKQPWVLSYDPAQAVMSLYSHNGNGTKHLNLLYSASSGDIVNAQELIITNLAALPKETRLWRSSEEWRKTTYN